MSDQAKAACAACQRNGVCPAILGGQGRTDANIVSNGWVLLAVWSAAFFLGGLLTGMAVG